MKVFVDLYEENSLHASVVVYARDSGLAFPCPGLEKSVLKERIKPRE
jgi:hypothetical protein